MTLEATQNSAVQSYLAEQNLRFSSRKVKPHQVLYGSTPVIFIWGSRVRSPRAFGATGFGGVRFPHCTSRDWPCPVPHTSPLPAAVCDVWALAVLGQHPASIPHPRFPLAAPVAGARERCEHPGQQLLAYLPEPTAQGRRLQ